MDAESGVGDEVVVVVGEYVVYGWVVVLGRVDVLDEGEEGGEGRVWMR